MRKIIYYVASSLDGFIAGLNEDISDFILDGPGVKKYQEDLLEFETVIMGRSTYEFGYKFGLQPGQPAYPHMKHYIFSDKLNLSEAHENVHVEEMDVSTIKRLKEESTTDIYLCGGGMFAGWLLDEGLVDVLKLKLNPVVLGRGIRLFGNSTSKCSFKPTDEVSFEEGLKIVTYQIIG